MMTFELKFESRKGTGKWYRERTWQTEKGKVGRRGLDCQGP